MCRLFGVIQKSEFVGLEDVKKATNSMEKGGPDGYGYHIDGRFGLGHRRLSIIDLSENGAQPFFKNQNYIVFNGEIYNYKELRNELESIGEKFTSNTDTEVILSGFLKMGIRFLTRLEGMFAFIIYNSSTNEVVAARDRFGVKPLYLYQDDNLVLFASEMKAIMQYPNVRLEIDKGSIAKFLHFGYVSAPKTIYEKVTKVLPSHYITVSSAFEVSCHKYERDINDIETGISLEMGIMSAIKSRLVSDVPVASLLSSGIDSTIVAHMLEKINYITTLYTLGFEESQYDEAEGASDYASQLGHEHSICTSSAKELTLNLEEYFEIFDEPFGDTSSLATSRIFKHIKGKHKVVLSADGADELFAGYKKYAATLFFYRYLASVNKRIRRLFGFLFLSLGKSVAGFLFGSNAKNRILKLRSALESDSVSEFFFNSSGYLNNELIKQYTGKALVLPDLAESCEADLVSSMIEFDLNNYLEGDILVKLDRTSMYHSIEAREPFLYSGLVGLSKELKVTEKIKFSNTKVALRFYHSKIYKKLGKREKKGFQVPLEQIIRSSCEDVLNNLKNDLTFLRETGISQKVVKMRLQKWFSKSDDISEYEIWFLIAIYKWYQVHHKPLFVC